jgi:hypothetical protein
MIGITPLVTVKQKLLVGIEIGSSEQAVRAKEHRLGTRSTGKCGECFRGSLVAKTVDNFVFQKD